MKKKKVELICLPEFISKVVNCVHESVGDGIKEDMHGLKTKNSASARIWDLLNTKLCEEMPSISCIADVTVRGSWQMVPVFAQDLGFLFTFMRESRFEELRKSIGKRKNPHYVDCLVSTLNSNIIASFSQTELYPVISYESSAIGKVVEKILFDLKIEREVVNNHVIVLFNSANNELISIRAVMVDCNLNIVHEENWSLYIPTTESIIMQNSEDYSTSSNNPNRNLSLSDKAHARKNRDIKVKKDNTKKKQKSNVIIEKYTRSTK